MQNIRIFWNNLYDLSTTTKDKSSEAVGFPLTNIAQRWHTRCWRSDGLEADQWITATLESAQNIKATIIKNHNFMNTPNPADIRIQASDDGVNWAGEHLKVDVKLDHHAGLMYKFWDTNQKYKWWRWYLTDVGNGESYFKIGRLFLGSYFSPARNFSYVSRKKLIDPSVKRYSSGGQISSNQKVHYRIWNYEFGLLTSAEADTMETIFNEVGQSKPYFICEDADDAFNTFYYVQNMNDWEPTPVDKIWDYYSLTAEVEEMR